MREGALETLRRADMSDGVIDWGIGFGTTGGIDSAMSQFMFVGGSPVGPAGVENPSARFIGPFAVGLAPDQKPAARYRSAPGMGSTTLADLLTDLASVYERPVLAVGRVRFDRLESDGGLDGQAAPRTFRNTEALLIALVVRHEEILNPARSRVFYVPAGMEGTVDDLMLASAAIITNPPRNWRDGDAQLRERIQAVVPVDPATSRVSVGEVDIYLIDSIVQP